MFLAGHAAAGAVIGQQIGANPLLIFALSFASHFLLDIIPHGDHHHVENYFTGQKKKIRKLYNVIITDSVATILMVVILLNYTSLNKVAMGWGIIGGVLPDLLVAISELAKNKILNRFLKLHFWFHNALLHSFKVKPLYGMIGQITIITVLLVSL